TRLYAPRCIWAPMRCHPLDCNGSKPCRSHADSGVPPSAPPGSHSPPPLRLRRHRSLATCPPHEHALASLAGGENERGQGMAAKSRSNEISPPVRGKTESWVVATGSKSPYEKDATTLAR